MGNVGIFIANSLAGIVNPPSLTLLLKTVEQKRRWYETHERLRVITNGWPSDQQGFSVEVSEDRHDSASSFLDLDNHSQSGDLSRQQVTSHSFDHAKDHHVSVEQDYPQHTSGDGYIDHLIVATKAPYTCDALSAWSHRLRPESSIVFLQNGVGVVDEVNKRLFPEAQTRPQYIIGINTHGLKSRGPFTTEKSGQGTLTLGALTAQTSSLDHENTKSSVSRLRDLPQSARFLLQTMTRTPNLVAVSIPSLALFQEQLDKLAINAVINPLTTLLDCRNGALKDSANAQRVARLLLAEISAVFLALPELQGVANVAMRFNPARLEKLVFATAARTASNDSSMLQDTKARRQTDIDYINGYISRRGKEHGIECVTNYMITRMVKAKQALAQQRDSEFIPFK